MLIASRTTPVPSPVKLEGRATRDVIGQVKILSIPFPRAESSFSIYHIQRTQDTHLHRTCRQSDIYCQVSIRSTSKALLYARRMPSHATPSHRASIDPSQTVPYTNLIQTSHKLQHARLSSIRAGEPHIRQNRRLAPEKGGFDRRKEDTKHRQRRRKRRHATRVAVHDHGVENRKPRCRDGGEHDVRRAREVRSEMVLRLVAVELNVPHQRSI
jgi:hypothetical protein